MSQKAKRSRIHLTSNKRFLGIPTFYCDLYKSTTALCSYILILIIKGQSKIIPQFYGVFPQLDVCIWFIMHRNHRLFAEIIFFLLWYFLIPIFSESKIISEKICTCENSSLMNRPDKCIQRLFFTVSCPCMMCWHNVDMFIYLHLMI